MPSEEKIAFYVNNLACFIALIVTYESGCIEMCVHLYKIQTAVQAVPLYLLSFITDFLLMVYMYYICECMCSCVHCLDYSMFCL